MSLARRLLAIVALALLPPLLIQVWTGIEQRRTRVSELRADGIAQARALQSDLARTVDGVRQLLVAIASVPAIRAGDAAACTAYLRDVAASAPEYTLLGADDADGHVLCDSGGDPPGSVDAARADHQRALATGRLAAGTLVGTGSLHFALPLLQAGGAPAGLVFASLDKARIERQLIAASVPSGMAAFVLDPSGTVILGVEDGVPLQDSWIGHPATPELRAALAATAPSTVDLVGPAGKVRLFAAAPAMPGLGGLRVTVAVDEAQILNEFDRLVLRNVLGLVAGLVLALAASSLTARRLIAAPLAEIAGTADRAAGRGTSPADGLQRLGAAVDRMSETIAARQAERDAAEAASVENEARYRALFEAIDVGFCIIKMVYDAAGQPRDYVFLEVNPAFAAQAGVPDALGRTALDVAPGLEQHWFETYGRVDQTQRPTRFESEAAALGRHFDVYAFPTGHPGDHRVAVLFTDVTERRRAQAALRNANERLEAHVAERTAALQHVIDALHTEAGQREAAEEALRQSQKMEAVGQLTGGIAHDFNNMLQGIAGSLEMVRRRTAQGRGAEATQFIDGAARTVERAAALTHRLLAFARRQALDPKLLDADALLRGMAELVRGTAGPAVQVVLDPGAHGARVRCDPNQLENVVLNLAINARDAMPAGGVLRIATAEAAPGPAAPFSGPAVSITVSDTGAGMDEAVRARAFEPFFTTKPIGQGTGLGLSQVYGFVRQSGGTIELDSAPGQGTTVRLLLPRHEPAADAPAPAPAAPAPAAHGRTVLLVDDEPDIRTVAGLQLAEAGYAVEPAATAAEALDRLGDGLTPDALVTDVGLPGGMNGRQLADAARARLPGLPVLFITGYAGDALAAELAPGMAVIGKPFTSGALLGRLATLLES